MKTIVKTAALAAGSVALAGIAAGQEVIVSSDIAGNEIWTANNFYNLQGQIYVLPGASLTIEAGTVVASDPGGSLAVSRGAEIFVNGTAEAPVIMTSKADVATWDADGTHPTGGDPTTGSWRAAATEWGNLTIMGRGYLSEDAIFGNVPHPDAGNVAAMEALTVGGVNVLYGGGDDDDDSGSVTYLNLRFGGEVAAVDEELNGLSLGALGRGTDMHHVEIMNNVDDGIEIWGGALNLKYFSIWNVGDDSLDFDQGWRGKAQFGLIVQGYSVDAKQGSGVGDNCMEMDGAENCNWQPVSSPAIYNMTVVGQPISGDHGTAWRDNARVQIRNSVFMDIGDQLVKNDGDDDDGACGYGGKALGDPIGSEASTFAQVWSDNFDDYFLTNPPKAPETFASIYQAQVDGKQAEIADSVFFRVPTLGDAPIDLASTLDNVNVVSLLDADAPIRSITRAPQVDLSSSGTTYSMLRVTDIDPRANNEAQTSVGTAPDDGFFTPAAYRGAFDANANWLCGWSTSDAFDFLSVPSIEETFNGTVPNPDALEVGQTSGPVIGQTWDPRIDHTTFMADAILDVLVIGNVKTDIPVPGLGTFLVGLTPILTFTSLPAAGFVAPIPDDKANVGVNLFAQGASVNLAGTIALTNAIDFTVGAE